MKDQKTGYSVSDHYFDDLKASIMTRIEVTEPVRVVTWRGAFKNLMGLAAGFILLVAVTSTVYYFATTSAEVGPTVELADSDVFILYNIDYDDILDAPAELTITFDDALAYVELYGYPSE